MKLKMRPYQSEDDYWRMRAFLRDLFLHNGRREWSWQPARLDYWRWHGVANLNQGPLTKKVFLWQSADCHIYAILNAEGAGYAYLQIHPAAHSRQLLEEMINVAETRLSPSTANGGRQLRVVTPAHDQFIPKILMQRGYHQLPHREYYHARRLDRPPVGRPLPAGFSIRALAGESELPARSWLSWRAFHPDEPDEKYDGWEWYKNIQAAPLYRQDLDLVVAAPNGELAAFATMWLDDETRCGVFEPVGTHPDYQRRGLGSALLTEGMRRLREQGATLATVGSGAPGACAFYESLGLKVRDQAHYWEHHR
ncbi:MAG: GNAT family N-acetyltransferase [Ardenticatenaceae bacterium]|nr:GNAT family N-acetyltransferase [Ardenticatenaceae bacterium]